MHDHSVHVVQHQPAVPFRIRRAHRTQPGCAPPDQLAVALIEVGLQLRSNRGATAWRGTVAGATDT
jgi:hypothetical protein